jgi:hypothetical protein
LITETLGPGILTPGLSFQTQLLKVVLTTLYVDIKEPAVCASFSPTKKPNLISGIILPTHAGFIMPGQN